MRNILSIVFLVPCWALYLFSRIPIRSTTLIVFGVHTNSFSGNVKELFLTSKSEYKKVFISSNYALVKELRLEGYKAHTKYSLYGIYYALRAGTYIYSQFPSDINFWLSGGARYINVWHGTPIKKIERDIATGYYSKRNRYKWFFGLVAPYLLVKPNALLVSSAYEEKCFKSAFDLDDDAFVRAFPPRLETLITGGAGINSEGNILYAPTWRDDHSFHFEDYVDLDSFNVFLKDNRIRFFIKLHPSDKAIDIDVELSNIVTIDKNEDVYDFLKDTDVLVSDYSSMTFESLYLSQPVVLFFPDYEAYQKRSRAFYIDPCKDLPVEVSYSQSELEQKLLLAMKERQVDMEKFEPFRPYPVQKKLLEQLVRKAHKQACQ